MPLQLTGAWANLPSTPAICSDSRPGAKEPR